MGRGDVPARGPAENLPGAEEAIELLLEEVGEETEEQPASIFAQLRGRVAVVTGGATGIGRRVALEFARRGVNIAFNWFDLPGREIEGAAVRTEAELHQLEVRVMMARVDVRDSAAVAEFMRQARADLGNLHFLVNAAGVHRSAPLWRMTDEQWRDVLDVNLTGAFNMIRAIAPLFREQGHGKIVNIASIQAMEGSFGVANYAASKAGLIALTRSAAVELGPANVNVNAVAPGFVRTEMLTDVPEEVVERSLERAALARLSEPEDIAYLVMFLCSEMARQITGQVVRVDGGLLG